MDKIEYETRGPARGAHAAAGPGRLSLARKLAVGVLIGALSASMTMVGIQSAAADSDPVNPNNPATPTTVTADALPTVQIDGVVWQQVVVGNTVYAVGDFDTARPAGSAPGTNTVVRNNILAYDIRTGVLNTAFAPSLNGQALAVAASPDGSTIYVGGSFTAVNGATVWRVAALNAANGQLRTNFLPKMDGQVSAIVATNSTVYMGGAFTGVGGVARSRLAAASVSNGALLPWAPVAAEAKVHALALSPDGTKMVVGGAFTSLNGSNNPGYGLGAVDATTGESLPFPINSIVRNASVPGARTAGAITSLTSDGTQVYGTGYTWQRDSTLEGTFSVRWSDFSTKWIEDCHGDSYGVYAAPSVVYVAGHTHYCGNIGGFNQDTPWDYQRALAFSKEATGTVTDDPHGYTNFAGNPAPALQNWFPYMLDGTFTGQNQGPWAVTGNSQYVVYGGEFPSVNGTAQQGLVRFAVKGIAPNQQGPRVSGRNFNPTVLSDSRGRVRVQWQANWDRDNKNLKYEVQRDAVTVYTTQQESTFWDRPGMTWVDTGRIPGREYRYRIVASDSSGNIVRSEYMYVTVSDADPVTTPYESAIAGDAPANYWRLGEPSGTTGYDKAGPNDLTYLSGITVGAPGAISNEANTALTLDGTANSTAANPSFQYRPNTFSLEAWVKTTTTAGGGIISFGNLTNGVSEMSDRNIYMDNAGRLFFGVRPTRTLRATVNSTNSYNDGQWHHVVATLGGNGMKLYVDGASVAERADVTNGQGVDGYWRIGGDNLSSWASRPTSRFLQGNLDEVAIYKTVLSPEAVARHYQVGTSAPAANAAPAAAFTSSVSGLTASVDGSGSTDSDGTVASYAWEFGDGGTATGATASHPYATAGTYPVKLTVTDDDGATNSVTHDVTVAAAPPADNVLAADAFGRTLATGLGSADRGGAWTLNGSASYFNVSGGTGKVILSRAGLGPSASLNSVSSDRTDVQAAFSLDKLANGGGADIRLDGRVTGTGVYGVRIKIAATGAMTQQLLRFTTADTVLATRSVGATYAAGQQYLVRVQVTGTNPTTISSKVWRSGTTEPAAWQQTITDSTAGLQSAGGVGFKSYLSGSATNFPVTTSIDDLSVKSVD